MSDEPKRDDDEAGEAGESTGGDRQAKEELFEAIDHFKSAASILFDRARNDPAVKSGLSEAERLAKKLGDAAEPLARQLTDELGRMTKDVRDTVEGASRRRKKRSSPPPEPAGSDEEE